MWVQSSLGWQETEADLLQCPDCFPFSHVPPAYYKLSSVKLKVYPKIRTEARILYWESTVQSTILISIDDGIKAK